MLKLYIAIDKTLENTKRKANNNNNSSSSNSTTQVIWSVTVCVTPLIHSCNNSEYS